MRRIFSSLLAVSFLLTSGVTNAEAYAFTYVVRLTGTSDVAQKYTANELNQITSGTKGLSLSYDANGNVTQKIENGITWTYTWNSENQLIGVTNNNLQSPVNVSYQYDVLGRRISRTGNGVTTQFVYDGQDILLEYSNGVLTGRYTHGPWIDEPLARTDLAQGKNYFYHADALGSITALSDNVGNVVESYRYSSYGVPTIFDKAGLQIAKSGIGSFYLYTGREYDFETGLYYHRARYRDSTYGQIQSWRIPHHK